MRKQQEYLNLIEETVNHYTSAGNKRAFNGNTCVYLTEIDGKEAMCAVGRCMHSPWQFRDRGFGMHTLLQKCDGNVDDVLKEEYRGFHVDFWVELQNFHDLSDNWECTASGTKLSTHGEYNVKELKRLVSLNKAEWCA